MSKQLTATLVRGKTYFLGTKRFDKGVPVTITEDEKRKLDADPSGEVISHEGGGKERRPVARFKFASTGESGAVPAPARRRGAAPAAPVADEQADDAEVEAAE